jgi:hypothetical protein
MYITREQREEARQYVQQKYGHYCNKARQMNVNPSILYYVQARI